MRESWWNARPFPAGTRETRRPDTVFQPRRPPRRRRYASAGWTSPAGTLTSVSATIRSTTSPATRPAHPPASPPGALGSLHARAACHADQCPRHERPQRQARHVRDALHPPLLASETGSLRAIRPSASRSTRRMNTGSPCTTPSVGTVEFMARCCSRRAGCQTSNQCGQVMAEQTVSSAVSDLEPAERGAREVIRARPRPPVGVVEGASTGGCGTRAGPGATRASVCLVGRGRSGTDRTFRYPRLERLKTRSRNQRPAGCESSARAGARRRRRRAQGPHLVGGPDFLDTISTRSHGPGRVIIGVEARRQLGGLPWVGALSRSGSAFGWSEPMVPLTSSRATSASCSAPALPQCSLQLLILSVAPWTGSAGSDRSRRSGSSSTWPGEGRRPAGVGDSELVATSAPPGAVQRSRLIGSCVDRCRVSLIFPTPTTATWSSSQSARSRRSGRLACTAPWFGRGDGWKVSEHRLLVKRRLVERDAARQ